METINPNRWAEASSFCFAESAVVHLGLAPPSF
jgi:hypothetical protein